MQLISTVMPLDLNFSSSLIDSGYFAKNVLFVDNLCSGFNVLVADLVFKSEKQMCISSCFCLICWEGLLDSPLAVCLTSV